MARNVIAQVCPERGDAAIAVSVESPGDAALLTAYSAGLAVPFLAAAVALPRLRPLIALLRRGHRVVAVVAGVFIVLVGVLVLTNAFWRLQGAFSFFL